MRSNDIAKLAGVTVRTLRHYHQIGLLPEPPREANGYRSYGMRHLVRLLRIGQLTALGLSLSELPALLDGQAERDSDSLAALHEALTRQIEALEHQRRLVAAFRDGEGPLDIPPELAASLMTLEAGRSEPAIEAGREQSVLLSHMVDDAGREELARLYDRLADPEHTAIALELGKRFDALGPESDERDIADLAAAYIEHLGPWLKEFDSVLRSSADQLTGSLLWTHAMEATNAQQRQVMAAISGSLTGSG